MAEESISGRAGRNRRGPRRSASLFTGILGGGSGGKEIEQIPRLLGHLAPILGRRRKHLSYQLVVKAQGVLVGEALWPQAYPVEALARIRANTSPPRNWFALYQQRPTSAEGEMFVPERMTPRNTTEDVARWVRAWDLAGSKDEGGERIVRARQHSGGLGESAPGGHVGDRIVGTDDPVTPGLAGSGWPRPMVSPSCVFPRRGVAVPVNGALKIDRSARR